MDARQIVGKCMFSVVEKYLPVQEAMMRFTGGPKLATVEVAGCRMQCWTSEKIYWLRDAFESGTRATLESMLERDSVLYDIGANTGFWEVALSSSCRRIFAFEPSPRNFARLQEHVSLNSLRNVELVNAAVSAQAGRLRFVDDGGYSHVAGDADGGVEVEALRIDDFIRTNEPPGVVKIDVEGHAPQVLAGMRDTLRQVRPSVLVELHHEVEQNAVVNNLMEIGYPVNVSRGGYPRFATALGDKRSKPCGPLNVPPLSGPV